MTIGKKIRKARRMADLTQDELATKAKITKETLYKIEKEISDPKWSTVERIASVLGISIEELR